MNNILIYEMANKDTYLYDNKTGLILNIDSSFLMVLNEMRKNGFLENKIYNNHNLEYYKFFLEKYDNLYKSANLHNKKKCTIKDIEKHIETHGMKQLIFDMTEQCNLRCKYCIYSDIPGDKLYVDTQGRLHICEKINFNFSIGDVYNGLNLKRISEIIERYNEEVLSKCKNCPISRICGTCYATFASNGYFEIPKGFCESKIKSTEQALKDLTEVLIHNPSYFKSKYSRNKNANLHCKDLYCY